MIVRCDRLAPVVFQRRSIAHWPILVLLSGGLAASQTAELTCAAESGRKAELIRGTINYAESFRQTTPSGWILRLDLLPEGWRLQTTTRGRETEDLSRLTPPWHFVPNPREIEGWHFRNADNTGPNDGSVNAPQKLREFTFSPAVGREIDCSGTATAEDVENVRSFGRGWLFIESFRLTPPRRGERAAFETITFSACLTWPAAGGRSAYRIDPSQDPPWSYRSTWPRPPRVSVPS